MVEQRNREQCDKESLTNEVTAFPENNKTLERQEEGSSHLQSVASIAVEPPTVQQTESKATLLGKSPCFGNVQQQATEDMDRADAGSASKNTEVQSASQEVRGIRAFRGDDSVSSSELLCVPTCQTGGFGNQGHSVTADSSMMTTTSHIVTAQNNVSQHTSQQRIGMTGREALLLSEPESDIACSDNECCTSSKTKVVEVESPLRKLSINQAKLSDSPLKDLEHKLSPLRASIHEMITSEVTFERHDIDTLLSQIEYLQGQVELLTQQASTTFQSLQKERRYRIHIQRALRQQERQFSNQQREQMRMVEGQLRDQESFILGIKLNLASLNKNYMEKSSELKKEQVKSATYAIEKKNLQHCLFGVKQALEETQTDLNVKQKQMTEAASVLQRIKQEQIALTSANQELTNEVVELKTQIDESRHESADAQGRIKELEVQMSAVEKENLELRRRLELISNLRKPHRDESQLSGEDRNSSRAGTASVAVDSAWSQAQRFGSDASSQSKRMQILLQESADSRHDDSFNGLDDFYNPIPAKQFSKHSQPSLAFRVAPDSYEPKQGIELVGQGTVKKQPIFTNVSFQRSLVSTAGKGAIEEREYRRETTFTSQTAVSLKVPAAEPARFEQTFQSLTRKPSYTIGLQRVQFQKVDR